MALGAASPPPKKRRAANGPIVVDDTSPEAQFFPPRSAWQSEAAAVASAPDEDPFEKPDPADVPDGAELIGYDISGFKTLVVNGEYSPDERKVIGRRRIFWHPQRKFFMYYCSGQRRWQIAPHWHSSGPGRGSIDLFEAALQGSDHCIARQVSETSWEECVNGSWQPRSLEVEHMMCVPAAEDESTKPQQPSLHLAQHRGPPGAAAVAASGSLLNGKQPILPVEHARRCLPVIIAPISGSEALDADPEMYRRVWVGWFPETVTSQRVLQFLGAAAKDVGQVHHKVGRWSEALIHFNSLDAASLAVKNDGKFLSGCKVQVGYYQPPEAPGPPPPEEPEAEEPAAIENSSELLEPGDEIPQAAQDPSACDMMHFRTEGGEVRSIDPGAGDDFWGESSPIAPVTGSSAPGAAPQAVAGPAKEIRSESSVAVVVSRQGALKKGRPRKQKQTS